MAPMPADSETTIIERPDGLRLRAAHDGDVEAIVRLQVGAFGEGDEPGVRGYLIGPGSSPANWCVVYDDDRLVASCALLPFPMLLDGVAIPAGQIEYVATDPDYQRRGLVRAQFDWHHRRSAEQGHLAQVIGGIPYFYRKLGYGYGISYPELFMFDPATLTPDPDVVIRVATDDDIPALRALDATRPVQALVVERDETSWRRAIATARTAAELARARGADDLGHERLFIAERTAGDGSEPVVVGWSSLTVLPDDKGMWLAPSPTADERVTDSLIAHALDQAGPDLVVYGIETPGSPHGRRLRDIGSGVPYGLGVYVRIPDPIAFLRTIRPVLAERLRASDTFRDAAGSVELSLYETGVAIDYAMGEVTGVRPIPGVEDPFDHKTAGVAPDWFPALVLGRWGAKDLEARIDDVTLGRDAAVLEVLFPQRHADVVFDL